MLMNKKLVHTLQTQQRTPARFNSNTGEHQANI